MPLDTELDALYPSSMSITSVHGSSIFNGPSSAVSSQKSEEEGAANDLPTEIEELLALWKPQPAGESVLQLQLPDVCRCSARLDKRFPSYQHPAIPELPLP